MKRWEELPEYMRNEQTAPYYEILSHKRGELALKRIFVFTMSEVLLLLVIPVMLVI